jgi:arylsulfatase A-like enzyme
VLLVTIDSLRADHVGAYGDADARTPALDALAADGVRFDRAYAAAPLTLPSHVTLLTGRYPPRHGVRTDTAHLDPAVPTIAGAFRRCGFATAAFPGAAPLGRQSDLDRGFDSYASAWQDADIAGWLEARSDRPVFVWVHLFEPHTPYGNPADRARVARPAIDRYDEDVAAADAHLGRLVALLGSRRADTLIVVTSDHGEAFGEHGEITHGLFVYDTTLRVPLVVSGPGVGRGRVAAEPVSLVDVAPTIAALAGLGGFDADGTALLPLSDAGDASLSIDRSLYAESFAPLTDFGWSPLRTIRRREWKYIAAPHPELYDLKNDPGETRNLVDDQPSRAAELAREIDRMSPLDGTAAAAQVDPKDRREIAARLAEVTSGELRSPLLERVLREIVRDDPGNGLANLRLGQVLAESGRCGEAVRRFTIAIAAHTPGDEARRGLARCGAQTVSRESR